MEMNHGSLATVYGIVALLSLLLWVGYLVFDKKKNRLFPALFGCVVAANGGYFLLSVSDSLAVAKLANGISYFGSAFSMLVMLLLFCIGVVKPEKIKESSDFLMGHMMLVFLPALVSIMNYFELIKAIWLKFALIIVISTVVTFFVAGGVVSLVSRLTAGKEEKDHV